ncbi:hypothetical protein BHE97_01155 [Aeromicrobium sp. PE09-221]|uniref:hypothetical protein n=1 Tax=Aeromicrobium sp. PE09-221 TaxID=1898043 RepID=UPI000B3ECDA8|nr:hypothetical protein [Aeromicrobium sp. PE09-221]OUZ12840.1 hypothetical protein BHE97_01155 [Aeromicrobium sp. PE09-221]
MRIYIGTDAAGLESLRSGSLEGAPVLAESEDEQHEYEAMLAAAEDGPVVVVAEIDHDEQPVTPREVVSFHTVLDDSGDLAWFAPEEIDTVVELLTR